MGQEKMKIVERIKKLMALAENQEGLPEGERAAAVAEKLMREHAIEMATIRMDEEEPVKYDGHVPLGHAYWKRDLWYHVGRHTQCRTSWFRHSKHGLIFGKQSDIEVCHYLFGVIVQQINAAARAYLNDLSDWYDRGDKRSMGNGFRRSAVHGVSDKLKAIRKKGQTADPGGTALVLQRRSQAVDAYDKRFGKPRKSRRGGRQDSYEFVHEGFEAGKNVSLHPGIGSSGGGKKISRTRRLENKS